MSDPRLPVQLCWVLLRPRIWDGEPAAIFTPYMIVTQGLRILSQSDQLGWSLSSGGPPAGFSAMCHGH